MGTHALLSPSSAHRWFECPGSVALSLGIEDTDNDYSREGTFAHEIAATALSADSDVRRFIGRKSECGKFECDAEMASHLDVYLEAVRAVELLSTRPLGPLLWVERKVKVTEDVYGTADAIIYDHEHLHVFDLKYGAGHFVAVENNKQLLIYALGALKTALVQAERDRVTTISMHIVQPRRLDANDEAHRTWTITRAELDAFELDLIAAEARAQQTDAPLTPGDHCTFCKAKHKCPALQTAALAAAQEVFDDGAIDKPVAPPALEDIPVERLAEILKAADRVEAWIDGVRKYAADVARKTKLPGYKLVQRTGNRRWRSEMEALAALQDAGVDPYEEPNLISPAQAEKRLGKQKGLVDPLTERPATGVLLVPDSDKRPALNVGDVFSDNLLN